MAAEMAFVLEMPVTSELRISSASCSSIPESRATPDLNDQNSGMEPDDELMVAIAMSMGFEAPLFACSPGRKRLRTDDSCDKEPPDELNGRHLGATTTELASRALGNVVASSAFPCSDDCDRLLREMAAGTTDESFSSSATTICRLLNNIANGPDDPRQSPPSLLRALLLLGLAWAVRAPGRPLGQR